MGAKVRPKKQEYHGNIFWVTMCDLFIGMFMIFATLFFAFSANTGQGASAEATNATRVVVQTILERLQEQNVSAVKRNTNGTPEGEKGGQFTDRHVDVEIDPFTGMARISDLELFKLNSAELTPSGKKFLNKFLPVYLDTVFSSDLKKYVMYIVIQGHTDSQLFRGGHTPQEQYMLNMSLSMNRAYNVANYLFLLSKNKPYYKELTRMIRVEGASFSRPVRNDNGSENYEKSRRVELRLVLKEQKIDILQQFFKGADSKDNAQRREVRKDHEKL